MPKVWVWRGSTSATCVGKIANGQVGWRLGRWRQRLGQLRDAAPFLGWPKAGFRDERGARSGCICATPNLLCRSGRPRRRTQPNPFCQCPDPCAAQKPFGNDCQRTVADAGTQAGSQRPSEVKFSLCWQGGQKMEPLTAPQRQMQRYGVERTFQDERGHAQFAFQTLGLALQPFRRTADRSKTRNQLLISTTKDSFMAKMDKVGEWK